MSQRLEGKVAIITGAASGIGRATATLFAQEGAKVVVADRNRPWGEETVRMIEEKGGEAVFIQVNVAKAAQVEAMVVRTTEHFGGLNVLVNAAAVLIRTPPLAEVPEADWDATMDVNLKGTFICCKYAIPAMLQSGGGAIVNIASSAGIRGNISSVPYGVSKAGVIHLTTIAAAQYNPKGIRINCITPGSVDTPQSRGSSGSAEAQERRIQEHPLRRIGRPEELAAVILFLASDEASYISGANFLADGGKAASLYS